MNARPAATRPAAHANGRSVVFTLIAIFIGIVAAGCGPERRDAPLTEPMDPDDPRVALGRKVFSRHCHQCHPGGASGLGPALNDKPLPVLGIKAQVRTGAGLMPAFPEEEIGGEELDGLVRYLKGLRSLRPLRPTAEGTGRVARNDE